MTIANNLSYTRRPAKAPRWGEHAHMARSTNAKSQTFSEAQVRLLLETLERHKRKFKNQGELAAALKITQPALSNLLKNKWAPGIKTANHIAQLDGYSTLEGLIGPIEPPGGKVSPVPLASLPPETRYPNLEACLSYWRGRKAWSEWAIAVARAGYCGEKDLDGPAWEKALDEIDTKLKKK